MKTIQAIIAFALLIMSFSIDAQNFEPCQLLTPADYSQWNTETDTLPAFTWTEVQGVEVAHYVFKLHHSVWDEIIDREVTQVYTAKTKNTQMEWPSEVPFYTKHTGSALYLWEVYPVDIEGRIISNHYDSPNAFSVVNEKYIEAFSMIKPQNTNPSKQPIHNPE